MKNILDLIENRCEIITDVAVLSDEEYALARRVGLGASDAPAYLGLYSMFGKSEATVIQNKCATELTAEEKEIGEKVNVRKGKDLEPIILQKFTEQTGIHVIKPTFMYRIKDFNYLTINFDGVGIVKEQAIPVEAKFTSTYGDRYWNYDRVKAVCHETFLPETLDFTRSSIAAHCDEAFNYYGVPAYYYAQVQQQMLGLGSDIGVVASLRDKDWTLYPFWIFRDDWLQKQIIAEGYRIWQKVERQRK